MSRPRSIVRLVFLGALVLALASCGGPGAGVFDRLESADELGLWRIVVLIALSTLISEDLACIAAGMLASEEVISLPWALVAPFLGIYLGDIGLYAIGRIGGIGLLRRVPFRWMISEQQVIQAEKLFEEYGGTIIFSSRLLPGSRLPIYAAAGVLNYPALRFSVFMFLAGALSCLVLVPLSMVLGEVIFDWLKTYEAYAVQIFVGAALAIWLAVKIVGILATRRSRLVFLVRLRRTYFRFSGRPKRGAWGRKLP